MSRKIDVGATLREALSIYRAQAGVLLPVAFLLFLAEGVLEGLARNELATGLLFVVAMVFSTVYQGMVAGLVRDIDDGRDGSARQMARSAVPALLPLLAVGILSGLGISIGLLLLIVPGLVLLTLWAVIAPVVVIERTGAMKSFGRSRDLVEGNGWPVFGAVLLAFLVVAVGTFASLLLADAIADGFLIGIAFSTLAVTVTEPFSALVAVVLYFRLRAIEEAVAPPAPAPPAPALSQDPPLA